MERLLEFGTAFRDWVEPGRPEDLCFLRADGSVWLGSVAHEGDVFLELAPDELEALARRVPEIVARLVKEQEG